MSEYVIALDQGTTSTRALVFAADGAVIASAQQEFPQHFPASGWVEHDPEDLWRTSLATISQAIEKAGVSAKKISALGITNQRETTIVWDKTTGKAIHNAIVWQDRRTAETCAALRADGNEPMVSAKTGLLLDPYFSATKAAFILDAVPGARARAERGELLFGTVDSFLIHRLTGGAVHATDATNASRSLLLDIHSGRWDADLCRLFAIPPAMLPDVRDCSGDFGTCLPEFFGAAIPIRGVAGDQQAATIGQACFSPGMLKSTYGTGCFALLNTGETAVVSNNRLLTTIAYQLGGKRTYALEGAIFIAGAAVQWLRDGLGIIGSAKETDALARVADPNQNVTLVPAFVGMGAPYWDAEARGALFGLTRATGPSEIARATLESVCFQTADLLEAMRADWAESAAAATVLRVDGGMVASDYTMQCLADLLGAPVDRPVVQETTALGAAILSGAAAGVMPAPAAYGARWRLEKRFSPTIGAEDRARRMAHWRDCVRRTLTH